MKKFLLLLASVATVFSANAIELTFWLGNQKITPGETVTFTDITVDTYDDGKEVMMKPELYLTTNIYSSDIQIIAECTSGQKISLCAGGNCMSDVKVVKDVTVRPNMKFDLGFDYANDELALDESIPTVVTTISAEDVTESGSKVQFVIVMGEKSASVTAVEISGDLQPVEGGIAYKVSAEDAHLKITSIVGINVFSADVNGEGFIALPKGLYVYTFGNRSGKIYIR